MTYSQLILMSIVMRYYFSAYVNIIMFVVYPLKLNPMILDDSTIRPIVRFLIFTRTRYVCCVSFHQAFSPNLSAFRSLLRYNCLLAFGSLRLPDG